MQNYSEQIAEISKEITELAVAIDTNDFTTAQHDRWQALVIERGSKIVQEYEREAACLQYQEN